MFHADENDKKAENAKAHAHDLAARMKDKFAQSDYTSRALAIAFKIDQGFRFTGSIGNK